MPSEDAAGCKWFANAARVAGGGSRSDKKDGDGRIQSRSSFLLAEIMPIPEVRELRLLMWMWFR